MLKAMSEWHKAEHTGKVGCFQHSFTLHRRSVPLDSLDWTSVCSRKFTPTLMDSRQGSVIRRTKIKNWDKGYSHDWHSASVFSHKALSPFLTCRRCIPKAFLQPTPLLNNSQPSFTFLPRLSEQPSVDNPGCSHSWRIQKIERYKDCLWLSWHILEHPIFKIVVWCFFFCFVSVSKETSKNAVALQIHPQTREQLWMQYYSSCKMQICGWLSLLVHSRAAVPL